MSQPNEATRKAREDADRRGTDRRNVERRAPVPPWRRPWAFAAYGVAGALALMLLWGAMRGGGERARTNDPPLAERAPGAPPVAQQEPGEVNHPAGEPVREASGAAGFERLMLEGAAARGRTVRAELFCEAPTSYEVNANAPVEAAVAALAVEGRIPGAECKWGGAGDARREDFLLLVPADLADDFAAAPMVSDDFQRRRRVVANVEWVGPSQALALRTVGVFRGFAR